MSGGEILVLTGFVVVLLAAAYGDLRSFRIPNILPVALLALFVPFAMVGGLAPPLHSALTAGAIAFGVGFVLFALRVWGGGDGKLLAALAPWVGQEGLARFGVVVTITGGVLAAGLLLAARFGKTAERPRQLPYGMAIAVGGLDWLLTKLPPL